MAKISKPTLTVSKEDINTAMKRLMGLTQGYIDSENLMESGANQLKYPAEKIIDYPSSVKPIDADKFICNKDDSGVLTTIESLYDKLEANRDYTVLKATGSFSFVGGVEIVKKRSVVSRFFLGKKRQESALIPMEETGGNFMSIPKSPSIVPVLDDGNNIMYAAYIRCKQNLIADCEIFVSVGEPTIHAEFIEFPIKKEFTLAPNPWTEGKHVDIFIDVEVLCEVLS